MCTGDLWRPRQDRSGIGHAQDLNGAARSQRTSTCSRSSSSAFALPWVARLSEWAPSCESPPGRRRRSQACFATWPAPTRQQLIAENALLRQQLIVAARSTKRPTFAPSDRTLLVLLARVVPRWRDALLLVQPATVLRWHCEGFKLLWRWKTKAKVTKRTVATETIVTVQASRKWSISRHLSSPFPFGRGWAITTSRRRTGATSGSRTSRRRSRGRTSSWRCGTRGSRMFEGHGLDVDGAGGGDS